MDNYKLKNNTYSKTPKDNPKDRIDVEIGDIKQADFYPQVKHQRWDNECNVSYRLIHEELNPTVTEKDGKVNWKGEDIEVDFYELTEGEGGYEMEVILHKKPKTNVVSFTLQDKDVEYFYQPELTQKEKDNNSEIPENVVGSYAVYAKTSKTNYIGGKEYKCGKVGHIYRPKIIDSNGTEVWGDLHIENGILTVTILQEFLDNAIYPVRHAAGLTFGYTGSGNRADIAESNSIRLSNDYYTGVVGKGNSMSISARHYSGTNDDAQMALYDSDAPSNLITNGYTESVKIDSSTKQWWTADFVAQPSLSAIEYSLVQNRKLGTSVIYYDYFSGGSKHYSRTFNTWNATETWNNSTEGAKYSIYVTYTASTGSIISPLPTFYQ